MLSSDRGGGGGGTQKTGEQGGGWRDDSWSSGSGRNPHLTSITLLTMFCFFQVYLCKLCKHFTNLYHISNNSIVIYL